MTTKGKGVIGSLLVRCRLRSEDRSPEDDFPKEPARCVACDLENDERTGEPARLVQVPCEHYYCETCMIRHFETSAILSNLPVCCGKTIPLHDVVVLMPAKSWEEKRLRSEMMAKYNGIMTWGRGCCADPSCGEAIVPDIKLKVGKCGKCKKKTCTLCAEIAHPGKCNSELFQQTVALAKKKGWKRCPDCYIVVEKTEGCSMVRCKCGTTFCYVCGGNALYHHCVRTRRRRADYGRGRACIVM
ncbi:hypothetical protein B0H63DRAFT_504907 [Podospora didyma]|uniref:RBR-type E3 ubiquitin transferase n=1 Tax=Podospora didyma TaxID=330526 RepID=A0AAE0P3U1_9PEZI|nr:hypothetical protein B0H63DRAFT_504907 [Podospora didyma]